MAWRPARQHHLPSRLWHALRRPRQRPSTVLHRRVAPVVVLRSVVVSTLWGARTPVGCPVCRLCSNAHRAVDCLWLVRRLSALPPWRSPAPHQPLTSSAPVPHQPLTSPSPFEPTVRAHAWTVTSSRASATCRRGAGSPPSSRAPCCNTATRSADSDRMGPNAPPMSPQ